jgi:membrane protein implicated in regulation of membrane protease activity
MIWILVGLALIALEAIVPTAFVALVSGVAALIVALVGSWITTANWQILLWLVLSGIGILASRRLVSKRSSPRRFDARSAQTLTAIAPGQAGRVLYEGNSWAARCEDPVITIGADQPVWVLHQQGTTLLIAPQVSNIPGPAAEPDR